MLFPDSREILRDRDKETGDPARLPAQLAGQWGQRNLNSAQSRICTVFCTSLTKQPRQDKILLYRHWQWTNQGRIPFICVLFEYPFATVSTVSKGNPFLVSVEILICTEYKERQAFCRVACIVSPPASECCPPPLGPRVGGGLINVRKKERYIRANLYRNQEMSWIPARRASGR
jgi:hypothetical protein